MNIFDQYGVKEVANVRFEALAADGDIQPGDIVLYLDSLKVSTIEETAENTEAKGGWGNPSLIMWDYGKEITVTLEDALISMESLRLMLGGAVKEAGAEAPVTVHRSAEVTVAASDKLPTSFEDDYYKTVTTSEITGAIKVINLTTGKRGKMASQSEAMTSYAKVGEKVRIFWDEAREGGETDDGAVQIVISPHTFPGAYRVIGDTFIRDTKNADHPFQFVINKAKVNSEVTLNMEAEGDPSTFTMSLRVLREGKEMMSLTRYD